MAVLRGEAEYAGAVPLSLWSDRAMDVMRHADASSKVEAADCAQNTYIGPVLSDLEYGDAVRVGRIHPRWFKKEQLQ
jgi:hypothetical protein